MYPKQSESFLSKASMEMFIIIMMQCMFITQFSLSIAIIIHINGSVLFQISVSWICVIYFLGLITVLFYFCKEHEMPRYLTICEKILYFTCYACGTIIIPIGIPIYLFIATLCFLYDSNEFYLTILQIFCLIYILPQNIIHWLIITINPMGYPLTPYLYLLTSLAILIAIFYYILFIYISVTFAYSNTDDILNKISSKLIFSGYSTDLLLLLLIITIYACINNDNMNESKYLFHITFIITICSMPLVLPYSFISHRSNSLIFKSLYRHWIIPSKSKIELYDKLYCIIHESCHSSHNSMQDELLSNAYSMENKITVHDDIMICIRYQYNYIKLDKKDKIKYVKSFEYKPIWKRYIDGYIEQKNNKWYILIIVIFHCIVILLRIYIMFWFPIYWFIYNARYCNSFF